MEEIGGMDFDFGSIGNHTDYCRRTAGTQHVEGLLGCLLQADCLEGEVDAATRHLLDLLDEVAF